MIYPCYLAIDITLQDLVLEELFIVLLIVSRMPTEQALTGGLPRSVSVLTAWPRKNRAWPGTSPGEGMGMGIVNTRYQCPKMAARSFSGCPEGRVLVIWRSQAKYHYRGYTCRVWGMNRSLLNKEAWKVDLAGERTACFMELCDGQDIFVKWWFVIVIGT